MLKSYSARLAGRCQPWGFLLEERCFLKTAREPFALREGVNAFEQDEPDYSGEIDPKIHAYRELRVEGQE